jgi:uncharacterized iron-regulated protein
MDKRLKAKAASLLVLLDLLAGCATGTRKIAGGVESQEVDVPMLALGDPARRGRQAALVLDGITDTKAGTLLTTEQLAAALKEVRLVFVGESHGDRPVHEAERRLLEALAASGRRVLVGLEMFPDSAQAALNRWIEGGLSEEQFLRESHWYQHWGHHWGYYREIFLLARQRRLRMFGVNVPRDVVKVVRAKGLDALSAEEKSKARLPPRIDTSSAEHRQLFRSYMADPSGHGALSEAAMDGMYRAQTTWDGAMAYNALRALEQVNDPRAVMVVLLGSGHVAFNLGAPRQAALWKGKEATATVIPMSVRNETGRPTRVRASYADFLWGVPPDAAAPGLEASSSSSPFPVAGVTLEERPGSPRPHLTVTAVEAGSPAARAGLQPADWIVSMDGQAVHSKESFSIHMAGKRWGDGLNVVVHRGGKALAAYLGLRRSSYLEP